MINRIKSIPYFYIALSFSLIIGFLLVIYFSCANNTIIFEGNFLDIFHQFFSNLNLVIIGFIWSFICFLLFIVLIKFGTQIGNFIYKFQLALAIIFIIICTIFGINTSSIGYLSENLQYEDQDIILNDNVILRSDEYAVSTPLILSQYSNDFKYFSNIPMGSDIGMDMYVTSGSPVLNPLILFRPFQIAFLFLPFANAFGFYFSSQFAVLIILSFWFGMFITNHRKSLSALFALMIVFSSGVQYWFYAANFVSMLCYGEALVLAFNYYLKTKKQTVRNWITLLGIYLGAGYLLVLYPAWQIPFFYIYLFLGIFSLIKAYRYYEFNRNDLVRLILFAIGITLIICYFFYISGRTIELQTNSFYPGQRRKIGGGFAKLLACDLANLITPFTRFRDLEIQKALVNFVECSSFLDFFPLGLLLLVYNLIFNKKKDSCSIFLGILGCIYFVYLTIGFPDWLARITLIDLSFHNRVRMAFTYINLILLFRSLIVQEKKLSNLTVVIFTILMILYYIFLFYWIYSDLFPLSILVYICLLISLVTFCYTTYNWSEIHKVVMLSLFAFITIINGATLNPVRVGMKPLTENDLFLEVKEIVQEDPNALWVLNDSTPSIRNIFPAAGARTLNSTNIYPNLSVWSKIDPEGNNFKYYNRYAEVNVIIQNQYPTFFDELTATKFRLYINIKDLSKLNVSYIYSPSDNILTRFNIDSIKFEPLINTNVGDIYRIVYSR